MGAIVRRPLVIGICGAQGSGKSTLARALEAGLQAAGRAVATLSIDDLYRTRAERQGLARAVHPLLATRGVPGTHDVALGLATIAALERGEPAALPRFDKASDDRLPRAQWPLAPARCQVLILEGWCVGARPQPVEALAVPVNALEAGEDPDGIWRAYANTALAGEYQALFARIDRLVLLAAPDFAVVHDWRLEQERDLAARAGPDAPGLMDAAAVARFIQHYERITRHILAEMPGRADLLVRLDRQRRPSF
ncbi:kinase [Novosphingobium sp. H3SJ31-1]|uniref:Kinase n=1 Tax=Novosphingobium album (ex Liu et al. 2023) TaxID=3031130 RepID=A0ABT5WUN0_9SPHN|nr:adenylyl-sulfate kinase [Novosphingobium album (ex Liu et al. 2023)]MDE8653613.1 kinase [Novosphingobium album (ex Liu et al. 2023)]